MTNFFILGPCSIENEENYLKSLEFLKPYMKNTFASAESALTKRESYGKSI